MEYSGFLLLRMTKAQFKLPSENRTRKGIFGTLWLQKNLDPGAKKLSPVLNLVLCTLQSVRHLLHHSLQQPHLLCYQLSAYRPRVRERKFLGLSIAGPTQAEVPLSLTHDILDLSHNLSPEAKPNRVYWGRGRSVFSLVIWAGVFWTVGCETCRSFPFISA